jgi:predicted HAD superfamily Cof-like phosphohydrolase
MDRCWEAVAAFHRAFGAPAADMPRLLTPDRVAERAGWLREEVAELEEAATVEEQADAMIDLIYFALGTLVEMGVRPARLFDIVHEANMQKLWPDGKPRKRPEDGKVLKPPTWQDPEPKIEAEIHRQLTVNNEQLTTSK